MIDITVRPWISSAPPIITPKESVARARELLREVGASELLVFDEQQLVGTLSERDIWENCPISTLMVDEKQANELLDQFRVAGVMALHPVTIDPDISVAEAAEMLAQSRRSGLPVLEKGEVIGYLTEAGLMRAVAMLLGNAYSLGKGNTSS